VLRKPGLAKTYQLLASHGPSYAVPSALAKQLTSQFGEQFSLATGPILWLDHHPGDATGLAFLGHGRIQAAAEPVRLFGGSTLVVHPAH
jgi:hypothetical protein